MKNQVIYDTRSGIILSITKNRSEIQAAYDKAMDGEDVSVTLHVDKQKVGDILKGYLKLKQTLSDLKPI